MVSLRRFTTLILLLSVCLVAVPGHGAQDNLNHKIGQMLMVGFRGAEIEQDHFIVRDIRQYHLGGVILFDYDVLTRQSGRNISSPTQLKDLIASLQRAAPRPLLVAVDQEGGQVARLKPERGFAASCSHSALGRLDDLPRTYTEGAAIAAQLNRVGINVNFAPVVDLCSNPDNPVIARLERCFSDQADKVVHHAQEFVRAHNAHGVTAVIKHFPGHGSSQDDSHLGFVDVSDSWTRAELQPYARLIGEGQVAAVMTAHVFNATLDPEHPATLSRSTITGLLRGHLGFDGVVLSDDLQMKAITEYYGLKEAVRLAINAGVDVLLFGNNLEYDPDIVPKVVGIIRELVAAGEISEQQIDESWRRILRLKGELALETWGHNTDKMTIGLCPHVSFSID